MVNINNVNGDINSRFKIIVNERSRFKAQAEALSRAAVLFSKKVEALIDKQKKDNYERLSG